MNKNTISAFANSSFLVFLVVICFFSDPVQVVRAQEKNLQTLIQDLKHDDDRIRRDAAMNLSELAGSSTEVVEAIPALVNALGDSEEQVWFHSVTALSKLGPDAAPAIPELINDLRQMRRRSVNAKWYRSAFTLGQIGEAAVKPLLEASNSTRPSVRAGAAKAMEWIPEASVQTVPVLIKLLEDDDEDVREIAAESLSVLPEPALKLLKESIHHTSDKTRKVAYIALGKAGIQAQGVSRPLLDRIQSEENSEILAIGIDALAKMGADREAFFAFLMSQFEHEESTVQQAIANAILSLPSSTTVPTLIGHLDSSNKEIQSRAASLLGHIGPPAFPSLNPLIELIEDTKTNDAQAEVFKNAFVAIGLKGIPVLLEHVSQAETNSKTHWVTSLLANYGMIGVASLEKALEKDNTLQILAVMNAFATMGSAAIEAEDQIVRMTQHETSEIRAAAVQALTSIGIKPSKLSPLIEPLLNDMSLDVRQSAVFSLRKSPEAAVEQLDKLNELLNDSNAGMRENALFAIASTGNQAKDLAEEVAMLLADTNRNVQMAAINTLGAIGSAPDLAIRQMAWLARNSDNSTLLNVLKALGRMGNPPVDYISLFETHLTHQDDAIREASFSGYIAIQKDKEKLLPVMINAIGDETVAIRHSSLKAMGSMREDAAAAIPYLIARLDHDEDQDLALGALRFMPSKIEFIGEYVASLEHDDPGVRHFGCRALGRMGKDAVSALPKLREARRDRYRFVRDEANKAIQRIED